MVPTTMLRLSISYCTVWPLSAIALENDVVFEKSEFERSALALENLNKRSAERIDVLRIQPLHNGFESTEQQIEVERRRGPIDRDLRSRPPSPWWIRAVDEFEVAVTNQVEIPDNGPGSGGEHDVVVGVELHQDLLVGTQRNAFDRSHPDTGDPDGLSLLQSRNIGEERGIPGRGTSRVLAEDE